MREFAFLGLDEVIEIHNDQIKRYGGHSGIRDIGLLKSAIAMPAAEGKIDKAGIAEFFRINSENN